MNATERLSSFLLANKRMTPRQRMGWTWLGNREDGITGVVVPRDGDAAGYRVTLQQLELLSPQEQAS